MKTEYSLTPPFPRNILMELTNACNFKCVYCGHEFMKRKKGFCDKSNMLRLIQEAYSLGGREIGFYMIGEPLLVKDLEDYVRKAKEVGYEYIYLTTNGIFASPERMKSLCNSGLDSINFSVSGATAETYAYIHGTKKEDWDIINRNLDALAEMRKTEKIKIKVYISYCECKPNEAEASLALELFADKADKVFIDECTSTGGNERRSCLVERGLVNSIIGANTPCDMIFNRVHITYQGYLDACCVDMDNQTAVADLNDISLLEAWNSDIMINLRRQHLTGNLENNMCYGCVHRVIDEIKPLNDKLSIV